MTSQSKSEDYVGAADLIRHYVERLSGLYRERATNTRYLKDARKNNPPGVPGLEEEGRAINGDIRRLLVEARARGFETTALETLTRESMETPDERQKRIELEEITELYRKAYYSVT